MDERDYLGLISKVKARIASHKHQIKRWTGYQTAKSADQFLARLEAKLRYLEQDLETLRKGRQRPTG